MYNFKKAQFNYNEHLKNKILNFIYSDIASNIDGFDRIRQEVDNHPNKAPYTIETMPQELLFSMMYYNQFNCSDGKLLIEVLNRLLNEQGLPSRLIKVDNLLNENCTNNKEIFLFLYEYFLDYYDKLNLIKKDHFLLQDQEIFSMILEDVCVSLGKTRFLSETAILDRIAKSSVKINKKILELIIDHNSSPSNINSLAIDCIAMILYNNKELFSFFMDDLIEQRTSSMFNQVIFNKKFQQLFLNKDNFSYYFKRWVEETSNISAVEGEDFPVRLINKELYNYLKENRLLGYFSIFIPDNFQNNELFYRSDVIVDALSSNDGRIRILGQEIIEQIDEILNRIEELNDFRAYKEVIIRMTADRIKFIQSPERFNKELGILEKNTDRLLSMGGKIFEEDKNIKNKTKGNINFLIDNEIVDDVSKKSRKDAIDVSFYNYFINELGKNEELLEERKKRIISVFGDFFYTWGKARLFGMNETDHNVWILFHNSITGNDMSNDYIIKQPKIVQFLKKLLFTELDVVSELVSIRRRAIIKRQVFPSVEIGNESELFKYLKNNKLLTQFEYLKNNTIKERTIQKEDGSTLVVYDIINKNENKVIKSGINGINTAKLLASFYDRKIYPDNREGLTKYRIECEDTFKSLLEINKNAPAFVEKLMNHYDTETIKGFLHKISIPEKKYLQADEVNINGFTFKILDKNDPLGSVLGNITKCCQIIDGAGEECVIDGYNNPMSGFLAIFDGSNLIAQSWLRVGQSKTLYLDNIETSSFYDMNYEQEHSMHSSIRWLLTKKPFDPINKNKINQKQDEKQDKQTKQLLLKNSIIEWSKYIKEKTDQNGNKLFSGVVCGPHYSDIKFNENIENKEIDFKSEFGDYSDLYTDLADTDNYRLAFNLKRFFMGKV
jgi:hypothetical protein